MDSQAIFHIVFPQNFLSLIQYRNLPGKMREVAPVVGQQAGDLRSYFLYDYYCRKRSTESKQEKQKPLI